MRVTRAAGRLLAGFIVINTLGELFCSGFAMSHFWIRSARLFGPLWRPLALLLAVALLLPERVLARRTRLRRCCLALCAGFALCAKLDAAHFWWLLARGAIRTPAVVPFSVLVAAVLGLSALRVHRAWDFLDLDGPGGWRRRLGTELALASGVGLLATLAFIFTYGPTDYTRRADCAVVLGSKAYRDGSPSLALYDRAQTAIDLYRRGLVSKLVMSGGVDRYSDGSSVSEPQTCRRLALAAGVPAEDIIVDERGVNSWATVVNVKRMAERRGWRSVLLVSHYYHLPRLRLAADRAGLRSARTVPARQTRRLRKEPWGVLRECAGLAYYYLFHLPRARG
jgi:uncharacterized SAM-binding protein YcdF (DUF218 family)